MLWVVPVLLSLLLAVVCGIFFGLWVGISVLALLLAGLGILAFLLPEYLVIRMLKAQPIEILSCKATPAVASGGTRIFVFSDPVPEVYIVRGLGQPGTLLLSQGLFSLLQENDQENDQEDDMTLLLKICVPLFKGSGIVTRSGCSILRYFVLSCCPSICLTIGRLAGGETWLDSRVSLEGAEKVLLQKLARNQRIWGSGRRRDFEKKGLDHRCLSILSCVSK